MMKLHVRTSTCIDYEEFKKVVTGPATSVDTIMKSDHKKFSGYAQKTKIGNTIGVFTNPEENAVVISMVRPFVDGGEQISSFYISKEAAEVLHNVLGKLLKGK